MGEVGCDVVVVGAGIVGCASAYELTRAGRTVTILDSAPGPAQGSTNRSFAGVRGQWPDPLNIALSWEGLCRYRDFEADHGVDVGYRPIGYLLLVQHARWSAHLAAVERQRSSGVPVEVLAPGEIARLVDVDTEGLAGATLGTADGTVDPQRAALSYLSMALDTGATARWHHPVTGIRPDPATGGWTITAGGERFRAQHLVNAAGGWASEVGALAGLTVPVVHSRRSIYALDATRLSRPVPMVVDTGTGFFMRSRGDRLLIGTAPEVVEDGLDLEVEWERFDQVLEIGRSRIPWLADLPLDRGSSWAGTYEVTPDLHAILGPDPAYPTWVNACGFSGHGVMQAPAAARLVAEQVVTGAITSLDVDLLRVDRFDQHVAEKLDMVF